MGRRRQSTAEDIVDLVALLPWWGGVGLAVVSYLLFHRLAAPATVSGGPSADLVFRVWISAIGMAGQFIAPLICCMAAIVSAVRRKRRSALVQRTSGPAPMAAIAGMTWREFELLVGEAFRLQGFTVVERAGSGPDGGIDLVLRRGGETLLVQCKHWRSLKVGVSVVRELFGVMAAEGAAGGFVVTAGEFTAEAEAFAQGRNVRLVNGTKLAGLLQQARATMRPAAHSHLAPQQKSVEAVPQSTPGPLVAPPCPSCRSAMVRRTAKRGANAGGQFWGCTRYPACKGTR